ncbi:hypothetical protein [Crocosphaera watsonii]|uniref:Phosphate ABC-transporter periplasmic phosphate-binding protein n=1 Tax=Crocosphaera watsonii WH 0003 TaxID=423471 RepID=G5JDX9_CROWT|nr:hypothetical protein [Crocosphaera watsonii]EHJ09611.1 phosphate ABC-transporter periplasmic phosphate-binding protein [Crocosphaera watsonii WH 0003]
MNQSAFFNGEYPLTRKLFVIVKKNGKSEEKARRAYSKLLLTNQGQKSLEKLGFVPIQ